MKPTNQKKSVNQSGHRKNTAQSRKQNRKNKRMTNSERAEFDDMNQIDWFPVDPYCD